MSGVILPAIGLGENLSQEMTLWMTLTLEETCRKAWSKDSVVMICPCKISVLWVVSNKNIWVNSDWPGNQKQNNVNTVNDWYAKLQIKIIKIKIIKT